MRFSSIPIASAFALVILLGAHGAGNAQPEHPQAGAGAQADRSAAPGPFWPGMMGPQMMQMMGERMMGPGMMGQMPMMGGRMGLGPMYRGMSRIVFALIDTDGDGALSLQEAQAAQERIFVAVDADNDGRVTLEELHAFFRGTEGPALQMPRQEDMPMRQGMRTPPGIQMGGGTASQAYMEAMQTMMQNMASMQMTGDAAGDFALMMIPHHQSAIDMARAFLEHSEDPELTGLANTIIADQQSEIEFLENWLREQGQ